MSFTIPEQFIAKYFGKMPMAVRIITYITLLFLFVYTSLLPEFIDGEIRIEDKNYKGEYTPYTLGKVSITIEGKDIITETNKHGKWSIPLIDKLPRDKTITFWYKDENRDDKKFDMQFIGFDLIMGKHLIVYHNPDSSPKFYVKYEKNPTDSPKSISKDKGKNKKNSFLNISSAYAQFISDISGQVSSEPSIIDLNDTEKQVIDVINKTISTTYPLINKNTHLFKDINITGRDEIKLKSNIEKEFKIELRSWEWNNIETVDDLVKLVAKYVNKSLMKVSKEVGYAYYGIQESDGNWDAIYFQNESRQKTERPQAGDIVKAVGNVNIRDGYIEYKFLRGWVNKKKIGLINPEDLLLVEEVKAVAGNYVWIKFRRILN